MVGTLGSFIGPLFGIMLAEYYVVSRQSIDLDDLFSTSKAGKYWYRAGFNLTAMVVLVPSTLVPLAGVFLERLHFLTSYAYFIGTGMAFTLYAVASRDRI